jgi:DNA-directed RNA polymerase specialized sigma24 family protein
MMTIVDVDAEYRAHAADLVRYATVLVGPHDANDVVNDAVTATIARGSLAGADDVRAYWFGAVARTAADWHRSSYRRRAREQRAAGRHGVVLPATPDDARALLAALSTQQRAVVYLTYWLDWPIERVAAALAVSDGTVKKQLARARDHLREVLGDDRA